MAKKGKRFKANRHGGPRPQPARAAEVQTLDLGYWNASVIEPPEFKVVQIVVAGAGGIGAYMVQHVGRLMRVLYESDRGAHLTVVDPDVVEEKNIGRQLFCQAEVGMPKAEAVVRRYALAWGLNASSFVGEYDESLLVGAHLTVLVGCVDNAKARASLAETLKNNPEWPDPDDRPRVWWLDCGNLKDTGRVLLGTAYTTDQLRGAFVDGKCIALPGPGMQSPGLLEPAPEDLPNPEMSCAEMAAANMQSLNINSRIASEASDFITRLLVTKDLKRFAFEVNLAAGSSRSIYSTPEEVARVSRRPVSFVKAEEEEAAAAVAI